MDSQSLTAALKQKALELGFDLAEATPFTPSRAEFGEANVVHLEKWLQRGYAGQMKFFAERLEAYRDPNRVLEGVKSVLMLGTNYRSVEPVETRAGQGRVSRYAWGCDYHDLIRDRLHELADFFQKLVPLGQARGIVDTAPFFERSFAVRTGLGWIGKNTALVNPKFGSWLFLAALLTTEELDAPASTEIRESSAEPLEPLESSIAGSKNPCENCRACLDACPTGALVAPYELDARRCISYLTVEHRGDIPHEFHEAIGNRLFGCDACQEACPWNRRTPTTAEKTFYPREGMNPVDLAELRELNEDSFRRRFRGTPLMRAKLEGLLRNAAIAEENGMK